MDADGISFFFCLWKAKNRNETGSNLSLGIRLTVLSKRLGHKCCCVRTPDQALKFILQIAASKNAFFQHSIFKFYLLSPISRSSFANLLNFRSSKICWKSSKLYEKVLAHLERMSLARHLARSFWVFLRDFSF